QKLTSNFYFLVSIPQNLFLGTWELFKDLGSTFLSSPNMPSAIQWDLNLSKELFESFLKNSHKPTKDSLEISEDPKRLKILYGMERFISAYGETHPLLMINRVDTLTKFLFVKGEEPSLLVFPKTPLAGKESGINALLHFIFSCPELSDLIIFKKEQNNTLKQLAWLYLNHSDSFPLDLASSFRSLFHFCPGIDPLTALTALSPPKEGLFIFSVSKNRGIHILEDHFQPLSVESLTPLLVVGLKKGADQTVGIHSHLYLETPEGKGAIYSLESFISEEEEWKHHAKPGEQEKTQFVHSAQNGTLFLFRFQREASLEEIALERELARFSTHFYAYYDLAIQVVHDQTLKIPKPYAKKATLLCSFFEALHKKTEVPKLDEKLLQFFKRIFGEDLIPLEPSSFLPMPKTLEHDPEWNFYALLMSTLVEAYAQEGKTYQEKETHDHYYASLYGLFLAIRKKVNKNLFYESTKREGLHIGLSMVHSLVTKKKGPALTQLFSSAIKTIASYSDPRGENWKMQAVSRIALPCFQGASSRSALPLIPTALEETTQILLPGHHHKQHVISAAVSLIRATDEKGVVEEGVSFALRTIQTIAQKNVHPTLPQSPATTWKRRILTVVTTNTAITTFLTHRITLLIPQKPLPESPIEYPPQEEPKIEVLDEPIEEDKIEATEEIPEKKELPSPYELKLSELRKAESNLVEAEAGVLEAQKKKNEKYKKRLKAVGPWQARKARKKLEKAEENLKSFKQAYEEKKMALSRRRMELESLALNATVKPAITYQTETVYYYSSKLGKDQKKVRYVKVFRTEHYPDGNQSPPKHVGTLEDQKLADRFISTLKHNDQLLHPPDYTFNKTEGRGDVTLCKNGELLFSDRGKHKGNEALERLNQAISEDFERSKTPHPSQEILTRKEGKKQYRISITSQNIGVYTTPDEANEVKEDLGIYFVEISIIKRQLQEVKHYLLSRGIPEEKHPPQPSIIPLTLSSKNPKTIKKELMRNCSQNHQRAQKYFELVKPQLNVAPTKATPQEKRELCQQLVPKDFKREKSHSPAYHLWRVPGKVVQLLRDIGFTSAQVSTTRPLYNTKPPSSTSEEINERLQRERSSPPSPYRPLPSSSPTWERSQQASLPHNLNPTYTPKKIPPLPEFPTRQEPLAITPPPNTRPTTTRPFGENPLASALFGLDAPPPSLLNHRGPATVLFSSAPHNLRPIQTPQFFINAKKHINRLVSEIKQDPQKAHANLNAGAIQGIGILAKETLKLSATLQPLNQAQKIVSCISSILGINTDPKFQRELAHGQLETIDRASSYLRSRYHSGLQRLDIDTNSAAFSAGSFVVSELLPYCIPMG
ncbi:MAG: hypothetical protein KDK60_01500, partial [Chlamydiia bacterium]|nr:hypothetical protein [Chlamydiia bacterium]